MRHCAVCDRPYDPAARPKGCKRYVCGMDCQREVWRRQSRDRHRARKLGPRARSVPGGRYLRRLLNDFDYVFPEYTGVIPWTPPVIPWSMLMPKSGDFAHPAH
jgi:hypothetical protein